MIASNKFLEQFPSNPSNQTPFVTPRDSLIVGIAGSAKNSTTAQVDIFIEGVKVADLNWTASDVADGEVISIPMAAGEKLSVKVVTGSISDPTVFVDVQGAV